MQRLPVEPLNPADYLLLRLAVGGDGRRSAGQLAADLKARLPTAVTRSTLDALTRQGLLAAAPKVTLTAAGRASVRERFGTLRQDRKFLENQLEPALCLGLAPGDKAASRLTHANTLRAVVLTRLYQLPLRIETVTWSEAFAALFARGLAGLSPAPADEQVRQAVTALTLDAGDAAKLRLALVRLSLALGQPTQQPSSTSPGPPQTGWPMPSTTEALDVLARPVIDITRTAHGGPFRHKTPIALIYDVYGRRHDDAGPLDTFKQRLLAAAAAGHLALLPLDDPSALDDTNRRRSELVTPTERLHFVERGDT